MNGIYSCSGNCPKMWGVERGSRHSKVCTLGATIRRLEDLQQLGSSVSQPPERIYRWDTAFPEEVPCENAHSSSPPPNLKRLEPEQYPYPNTEAPSTSLDTLFPDEMTSGYPSIQEDVLPTYSATCACASAYGRRDAPSLVGLDLSVSCVRDACRPYESPYCF